MLAALNTLKEEATPEHPRGRGKLAKPKIIISSVLDTTDALSSSVEGAELDAEMWRALESVGVDPTGEMGEFTTRLVFEER